MHTQCWLIRCGKHENYVWLFWLWVVFCAENNKQRHSFRNYYNAEIIKLWTDNGIEFRVELGAPQQIIKTTLVNAFFRASILHCWCYYWTEQTYCTLLSTGERAWLLFAAVIINSVFILWNIFYENVLPCSANVRVHIQL